MSVTNEVIVPRGMGGDGVQVQAAGHEFTLFTHSQPLIAAMVEDIQAATHRVWLESYIFAEDAAGQAIAAALIERAQAGVDVRVMYDSFGSLSTSNAFFARLAEAGVLVHGYHSLFGSLWRLSLFRAMNRRNHRKLLIVDDRAAYFGGMNIVDQSGIASVADAKARHLPASAGWRDVHVRLAGPRVSEVAAIFNRLWRRVHGKKRKKWPLWPLKKILASQDESLSFFDFNPMLRDRRAHLVFVPLIRLAQRDITLSMAYFVPVGQVLRELLRARRRGVKIRVIVPGLSDVWLVQWATRYLYSILLKYGVRIYERRDHMLHSKVMVIDGQWTVVGSCNLDPRSLRLNLEFLAAIRAPSLAAAVNRICGYEMRNSDRITPKRHERRAWWQRVLDRLVFSFLRHWL